VRINGSFSKGAVITILLTLIPVAAFSAQKITSGSTCKTYKQKVTYQNKIYTCSKSGKKFVWDKGVAIKKPTAATTPTPIATKTPASTSFPLNPKGKFYSIQMAKAHLPVAPNAGYDDYRCFLLDPKVEVDSIIQSIEFIPQRKNYVHHAIIFRVSEANLQEAKTLDGSGTGWPCFGGSGLGGMFTSFVTSPWISAWAPGKTKDLAPTGYGIPFKKDEQFVLQVHYNLLAATGGKIETDQSRIVIEAVPVTEATVKPLSIELFAAPVELACPAGVSGPLCDRAAAVKDLSKRTNGSSQLELLGIAAMCGKNPFFPQSDVVTKCDQKVRSNYTIVTAAPHMHLLGRKLKMTLNPGTAREQVIINVEKYDFDDQSPIELKTPLEVVSGDVIRIECTHDPNIRQLLPMFKNLPPRYVTWGEGSSDEMCLGVLSVSRK
jgi:hypothetical protein